MLKTKIKFQKMKSSSNFYKITILFLTIFILGIIGCEEKEVVISKKKETIRPVKTKVIQFNPRGSEKKEFSGIAQSDESSILSFRVPGVLTNMNVEVGDQVKKGDVVATLDDRDFRLSVRDLESQFTTAQAELDQIKKGARSEDIRILENKIASMESTVKRSRQEYQRVQQLYVNDAASKGRLDQAKNSLDKALLDRKSATEEYVIATHGGREEEVRAQTFKVESIASNLEQARVNLSYTELKAPFDGEIAQKHVSNFEQMKEGQDIYTLVDLKHIEIQISVPEDWISRVKKKQSARVEFSKFPEKKFKGWIDRIGVSANLSTLTYPVVVKIPNSKGEFLPGMSTNVSIQLKGLGKRFPTVPIHSILKDSSEGGSFVWLVNRKNSTVVKTKVEIGKISNDEVSVVKGLKNGDSVVIAGTDRLKDGMTIRLNPEKN